MSKNEKTSKRKVSVQFNAAVPSGVSHREIRESIKLEFLEYGKNFVITSLRINDIQKTVKFIGTKAGAKWLKKITKKSSQGEG